MKITQTNLLRSFRIMAIGGLSLTLACQNESSPSDQQEPAEPDAEQPRATTYWQDVAPIYFEHCVGCHSDGGIAPFVLDDYSTAAAWAHASAAAVRNRVMPPWLVTDDGSCNEWQHSRTLAQDQIDTILAWVEDGMPEGQPRDDLQIPEPPRLTGATPIRTPEFIPEPQGGMQAEYDEYRCFMIEPQLERDMFITGYEVVPGNPAIVHHLLAMVIDPDLEVAPGKTNRDFLTAYDDESPDRLGWPCFGIAGEEVVTESLPVGWAPGQGVVEFPADSGTLLARGDVIVVQIHYNMHAPGVLGQSDSTTINLRLEPEVSREVLFELPDGLLHTTLDGDPHALEPGSSEERFTFTIPADRYRTWLGSDRVELLGVFPHMHNYGVGMQARVLDAEGQERGCVVDVFRWEYQWQLYYFYERPIVLSKGDTVEVTCVYDTSRVSEPIWPGWGTNNEMCLLGMYVVAAP
jgi:mono/diheme cytochrome c family protein